MDRFEFEQWIGPRCLIDSKWSMNGTRHCHIDAAHYGNNVEELTLMYQLKVVDVDVDVPAVATTEDNEEFKNRASRRQRRRRRRRRFSIKPKQKRLCPVEIESSFFFYYYYCYYFLFLFWNAGAEKWIESRRQRLFLARRAATSLKSR